MGRSAIDFFRKFYSHKKQFTQIMKLCEYSRSMSFLFEQMTLTNCHFLKDQISGGRSHDHHWSSG